MQEYRAYLLDSSGHVSQSAIIIREADDAEAIESAIQLIDTHDLELWQGARHIVTLRADPSESR